MNLSHAVAVVLSGIFERRLQLLGLADLGLDVTGMGSIFCSSLQNKRLQISFAAAMMKVRCVVLQMYAVTLNH